MSDEKTVSEKVIDRLRKLSAVLNPRYMRIDQAIAIYRLMCRYRQPPTRIVEIGTYCGTGAILLAAMVEQWDGHVTTIDLPWIGSPNQYFDKTVDYWIEKTGTKNVTTIRRDDGAEGWFLDYYRQNQPPLDFVYIDGGHQWMRTCSQFSMAYASLRRGGWLCFDDTANEAWPEVGDCWRNVVCRLVPKIHRYTVGQLGFCMR